jgi:hypothetical protein
VRIFTSNSEGEKPRGQSYKIIFVLKMTKFLNFLRLPQVRTWIVYSKKMKRNRDKISLFWRQNYFYRIDSSNSTNETTTFESKTKTPNQVFDSHIQRFFWSKVFTHFRLQENMKTSLCQLLFCIFLCCEDVLGSWHLQNVELPGNSRTIYTKEFIVTVPF